MSARKVLFLSLLLLLTVQPQAVFASAENFKSKEFYASGSLDVINAAEAYALGYTGQGQVIGILDTAVRIDHPELMGKADRQPDGDANEPVWNVDTVHGSHVAGIMAAKRDGVGMHGVAFDAGIWAGEFLSADTPLDLNQYFSRHPEVRIFNNSWGGTLYLPTVDESGTEIGTSDYLWGYLLQDAETTFIVNYAQSNPQAVLVFAAGNDGQISPNFASNIPRYVAVGDLSNWINVGAVNANNGCITKADNGELVLNEASIPWFTDLAKGSELYTVMAPGSNILSLDASTNGYIQESGTSMAAPAVSGALALVAQAYPWMNGKQLADSVLTTANNSFEAPEYAVLYSIANVNLESGNYGTVRFVIIAENKQEAADVDKEAIKPNVEELLDKQIQQDPSAWVGLERLAQEAVSNGDFTIEVLTKEEVYGQGILDVSKAVHGPARLDANRMTAKNVLTVGELNQRQFAIETFDTQGYVAEFSNDISQRKWDDTYHHPDYQTSTIGAQSAENNENRFNADMLYGKDVGLRKAGAGMLVLSGSNSYAGATLVEGGVLAIAKRTDGSGGELLASEVVVREHGTLTGDGLIVNEVINKGVVAPGFVGKTLTVGSYKQTESGALRVTFDNESGYSVLSVNGVAQVDGSLSFAPTQGQFYANNYSVTLTNFLEAETINGNFDQYLAENAASPTLQTALDPSSSLNHVSVTLSRPVDAYAQYATNSAAADLGRNLSGIANAATGDMQALLASLDWSASDGHQVQTGLDMLGSEPYDASARVTLAQHNEFNQFILWRLLGSKRALGTPVSGNTQSKNDSWQSWATTYGSGAWQDSHGSVSSWRSLGMGLIAGADTSFESGLTLGGHVALAARRTHIVDNHDAQADTKSAYFGLQALYAPDSWNGYWLMSQGRLGIEDGKMTRTVSFNSYARNNDSRWNGFGGGALLGAGKDWHLKLEEGQLDVGPLAWLEYSFLKRPDINEHSGQASRLNLDDTLYQSLQFSLGAHATLNTQLESGTTVEMNLLTAWRHEILDGTFHTNSSFRDYGNFDFTTATDVPGKDAMLLQSSVRFTQPSNSFVQAYVGGEFFRKGYTSVNVGVQFGWTF